MTSLLTLTTALGAVALTLAIAGLVAVLVHLVTHDGYGCNPPPRSHPGDDPDWRPA